MFAALAALALTSATRQMVEGGADPTFIAAAFGKDRSSWVGSHFHGMHVTRPKSQRQRRRDARRVQDGRR